MVAFLEMSNGCLSGMEQWLYFGREAKVAFLEKSEGCLLGPFCKRIKVFSGEAQLLPYWKRAEFAFSKRNTCSSWRGAVVACLEGTIAASLEDQCSCFGREPHIAFSESESIICPLDNPLDNP